MKLVFQCTENIVGKGENAGLQNFSPFSTIFFIGIFSLIRENS